MSLDMFSAQVGQSLDARDARILSQPPEPPGVFKGFGEGAGKFTMRKLAEVGRSIDLLGAVGPIIEDKILGAGTAAQDRYFAEHDELFNSAVDYWTPRPDEVGVAGQIAGQLVGTLATVLVSPHLAVGSAVLSQGEELVRKGVPAGKATAAGIVEGASLAAGLWLPIFGKNLWQRTLVAGAGVNVAQGVATRGIQGAILADTPAEGQFKAWGGSEIVLDALLGVAFGSLVHLDATARAEVEAARANGLNADTDAALRVLNNQRHWEASTAPARPDSPAALDLHVSRMTEAVRSVLRDEPVNVEAGPMRVKLTPERLEIGRAVQESVEAAGPPVARLLSEAAEVRVGEGDPLFSEAQRYVDQNPDMVIDTGARNPDGTPIRQSLRDYLDEADDILLTAREEARLFGVAAACILGAA